MLYTTITQLVQLCLIAAKLAQWALIIQELDLEIRHRSGKQNTNVDVLSRYPVPTCVNNLAGTEAERANTCVSAAPMSACESAHSEPMNSCESALAEYDLVCNSSIISVTTGSGGAEDGGRSISMDSGSELLFPNSPSSDDLQTSPVARVSEIAELQRQDAELSPIVNYLEDGTIPTERKLARRLVMERSQFDNVDGLLYYENPDVVGKWRIAVLI